METGSIRIVGSWGRIDCLPRRKKMLNCRLLSKQLVYNIDKKCTVFFLMINIGNYRELLLKLFCMELKLRKCLFLQKFNVRKLSLFGRLNTISGTALTGRGRISTGRRVCHGAVGVWLAWPCSSLSAERGKKAILQWLKCRKFFGTSWISKDFELWIFCEIWRLSSIIKILYSTFKQQDNTAIHC